MAINDINALDKTFINVDLGSVSMVRPLLLFSPFPETCSISLKPDTILKQPCHIVPLTNFKPVPKEITPFSSEFLGMPSELRNWNDEFS